MTLDRRRTAQDVTLRHSNDAERTDAFFVCPFMLVAYSMDAEHIALVPSTDDVDPLERDPSKKELILSYLLEHSRAFGDLQDVRTLVGYR
jgi:hypothetical protein